MANNPAAANRVATMIATFKWIVIGLIGLFGFLFFVASVFAGDEGIIVGFFALIGAALYSVVVFVLFGWFEQTLRMLANIASNTSLANPGTANVTPPQGYAPPYGNS